MTRLLPYIAAGAALGLAQLTPRLSLLAWLGIALLTVALDKTPHRGHRVAGLLLVSALNAVITLHWMPETFDLYRMRTSPLVTFSAVVCLITVITSAPMVIAAVAAVTTRLPAVLWLPPAFLLGEALEAAVLNVTWGHLLYSQWQVAPVLRALPLVGWHATLLLGLIAAASLATGLHRRSLRAAAPGFLIITTALALPATTLNDDALAGLGAVHMADMEDRPTDFPDVDVLIWPEGVSRDRPRVAEGRGPYDAHIDPLPGSPRLGHLLGLSARTPHGFLNAATATTPDGQILAVRGKSSLVPGMEFPLMGVSLAGDTFQKGTTPPMIALDEHALIPVICYEAFAREVVAAGKEAGGTVIVSLSSDRPVSVSPVALRQIVAALALRSAEYGLPAIRASMWGSAAVISSDGTVLHQTTPGTHGVLTPSAAVNSQHDYRRAANP